VFAISLCKSILPELSDGNPKFGFGIEDIIQECFVSYLKSEHKVISSKSEKAFAYSCCKFTVMSIRKKVFGIKAKCKPKGEICERSRKPVYETEQEYRIRRTNYVHPSRDNKGNKGLDNKSILSLARRTFGDSIVEQLFQESAEVREFFHGKE
jgi:DNA-directed RNA polymerase specialized sigma24 family protein